jgi:hypothetical protein
MRPFTRLKSVSADASRPEVVIPVDLYRAENLFIKRCAPFH